MSVMLRLKNSTLEESNYRVPSVLLRMYHFTEECYLGQDDKQMTKYDWGILLVLQVTNEAASAGCLAQGTQPTHHPSPAGSLSSGIISHLFLDSLWRTTSFAKHIYSLQIVDFQIVCRLQVARKPTVVKTSNFCVLLTCFFVKNLMEVGRRRMLWQLTPLFQDNWTGCTWFCAGEDWQSEQKETLSSKLLGCFHMAGWDSPSVRFTPCLPSAWGESACKSPSLYRQGRDFQADLWACSCDTIRSYFAWYTLCEAGSMVEVAQLEPRIEKLHISPRDFWRKGVPWCWKSWQNKRGGGQWMAETADVSPKWKWPFCHQVIQENRKDIKHNMEKAVEKPDRHDSCWASRSTTTTVINRQVHWEDEGKRAPSLRVQLPPAPHTHHNPVLIMRSSEANDNWEPFSSSLRHLTRTSEFSVIKIKGTLTTCHSQEEPEMWGLPGM